MKIKNLGMFIVLYVSLILSGCAQWTITGQNSVWKVDKKTPLEVGDSGYKLVGPYSSTEYASQPIDDSSDVMAISLKTLYLKYIQDIYNFDVVVYAEVYDEVDETKVLKRIAFHRENQPPTSQVNFNDALLYGPIYFNGYPITVKLYVLELDKKDNELFSDLLKVVSSVATTAEPQYGSAIEMAAFIMRVIISLNQDDLELSHEITFVPASDAEKLHYSGRASLLLPLETGDFVIVKKEDPDRVVFNRWWRFAKRSEEEAKNKFAPGDVYYDAQDGKLKNGGKDFEDKTYAVLTISKRSRAADRALLEKISNDVQKTLGEIKIASEESNERIKAIKRMADRAEAEVKLFDMKNRIAGKTDAEKRARLAEFLKEYKDETKLTESDKLVKAGIERLLDGLPSTTTP